MCSPSPYRLTMPLRPGLIGHVYPPILRLCRALCFANSPSPIIICRSVPADCPEWVPKVRGAPRTFAPAIPGLVAAFDLLLMGEGGCHCFWRESGLGKIDVKSGQGCSYTVIRTWVFHCASFCQPSSGRGTPPSPPFRFPHLAYSAFT